MACNELFIVIINYSDQMSKVVGKFQICISRDVLPLAGVHVCERLPEISRKLVDQGRIQVLSRRVVTTSCVLYGIRPQVPSM